MTARESYIFGPCQIGKCDECTGAFLSADGEVRHVCICEHHGARGSQAGLFAVAKSIESKQRDLFAGKVSPAGVK